MKVTLHEVAARADVSIATVSRALNGLPVSKESRARVQKAVAELGYIANDAARALRSERTMTMGLIFSDLRNMLGIDLLDALSESIEDAGYSLILSTARGDAQRYDVLMHRFLERRVDALFCIRPRGKGESLARYNSANIPVISLFNAGAAYASLPIVTPAFTEPAKAVSEHLKGFHHKRVAILHGRAALGPIVPIGETLRTQGFHVDAIELAEGGSVSEALSTIMAKKQRATAVIAVDPLVRGLLTACQGAHVKVPDDLSIISVCDIAAESYHKKHDLSTVMVDPHRMGRAAGGAMLAWLAGSRPADKVRVQAAAFVARGSTSATAKLR